MSPLGIYFGPKAISVAQSKGRKIASNALIPQSTIFVGDAEDKVPAEAKIIEIIALLKDELRRNKVEEKEAAICLSGNDLIIRTFEIPLLPREELASAINFEAKKYIPFKVEDLVADFQVRQDTQSHTNLVLYAGIKKDALNRYFSILTQLGIKITSIEYSAFSLLRALKLGGANDKGVVAVIGADLQGQDEVNFTVLEDGFPLFSRDIAIGLGSGAEAESSAVSPGMDKLKTEIRVSLDYYRRKFPNKAVKKAYLISSVDYTLDLGTFMQEFGVALKFINIAKFVGASVPLSLNLIKAYSASLSKTVRTAIKVDLLKAEEKAKAGRVKAVQRRPVSIGEQMAGFKLDFKMVALALLICGAAFGIGVYQTTPLREKLNNIISLRPKVSTVSPDISNDELAQAASNYQKRIGILDKLIKKQLYCTEPLNIIPQVLPEGVWLTGFNFSKINDVGTLDLQGTVYLPETEKEFEAVNKFVSNLKSEASFSKYFKVISLNNLNSQQQGSMVMANFSITCKTNKARE